MNQFLRFLLVGGFAAFLNVVTRILVNRVMSYESSIVIAFFVGLVSAYSLNRIVVFNSSQRRMPEEFGYFLVVNLAALIQTYVISLTLANHILPAAGIRKGAETLGHIAGVMTPVLSSFYLHKYWTFRSEKIRTDQ